MFKALLDITRVEDEGEEDEQDPDRRTQRDIDKHVEHNEEFSASDDDERMREEQGVRVGFMIFIVVISLSCFQLCLPPHSLFSMIRIPL